jgi:uncharacterized repeat protein (TIGR03803 family)
VVLCPTAFGAAVSQASAGTFTTLYEFTGATDGSDPNSSVIEDAAQTLYGETMEGADKKCATKVGFPSLYGCGTLFSFSASSGLKTLVTFTGPNGAYGKSSPTLIGSTLYGSAYAGGSTDNGVLFTVLTDGTGYKLIHQFVGTDGSLPVGGLVAGPGSVLYGVTSAGGPAYPAKGYGVLFRLSAAGSYTVLHSFNNGVGGGAPNSIRVEKSGLIVGTTLQGGSKNAHCGALGCGIVYSYNPSSAKFTVLHTFDNDLNPGDGPVLGSVASDGTIYGNAAPFFSIGPKGFSLLPGSSGGLNIGGGAPDAPTLGPDGSLTSTEQDGPYSGSGTLFQQLNGVVTVLHYFGGYDGGDPEAAPLLTPSGSLIGTAAGGGLTCNCGTIYEYVP